MENLPPQEVNQVSFIDKVAVWIPVAGMAMAALGLGASVLRDNALPIATSINMSPEFFKNAYGALLDMSIPLQYANMATEVAMMSYSCVRAVGGIFKPMIKAEKGIDPRTLNLKDAFTDSYLSFGAAFANILATKVNIDGFTKILSGHN